MNGFTDHTPEVERRIAAIRTLPGDSCVFFKPRDGTPVGLRQCWYCAYGVFDVKSTQENKQGLCKFRK